MSSTLELREMQQLFGAGIWSGDRAALACELFSGPIERNVRRLAIYRGNVFGNAHNALRNAYPITEKIVGEQFFAELAKQYARRHPSSSGDLNVYGAKLPGFIRRFSHTRELPYLPDVAAMEWKVHRAYYAADPTHPALDVLVSVPPERWSDCGIELAPCCNLMQSDWPLARLWEIHQPHFDGEFSVDMQAGPHFILVYRADFRAGVMAISPGAYRFLEASQRGASIGAALAEAQDEELTFDLTAALPGWAERGTILGVRVPAASPSGA